MAIATHRVKNQRGTFPFSSVEDLSEKHIQEYNNELKQLTPGADKCKAEVELTNKISESLPQGTQIHNENEVLKTNSNQVLCIGSIRQAESSALLPNERNDNADHLNKASDNLASDDELSWQKRNRKQRRRKFVTICMSSVVINLLFFTLTSLIIHYNIIPNVKDEKYPIQSTTLHIKWDELQNETSFIPWIELDSTFISINGYNIFVKEDGFYVINAIFNLDSSNESYRNRTIMEVKGLVCLRSTKKEVCQKSILANGTALTVPLLLSSKLTTHDNVNCSVIGTSLISRYNAKSYLEITKFSAR